MFSNRFYRLKLAAGVCVIALFGIHAAVQGRMINPAIWVCLAEPERFDGVEVRMSGRVLDVSEFAFTLDAGKARVSVQGVHGKVSDGATVEVRGVFVGKGDPHVLYIAHRPPASGTGLRWLVEFVSIVVLGLVLWNFWRRFSVHPRVLQVGKGS